MGNPFTLDKLSLLQAFLACCSSNEDRSKQCEFPTHAAACICKCMLRPQGRPCPTDSCTSNFLFKCSSKFQVLSLSEQRLEGCPECVWLWNCNTAALTCVVLCVLCHGAEGHRCAPSCGVPHVVLCLAQACRAACAMLCHAVLGLNGTPVWCRPAAGSGIPCACANMHS